MDRPNLNVDADDRFLAFVAGMLIVAGCAVATTDSAKKDAKPKPAATSSIEATAFAACQSRDAIAADKLDELATKIAADEVKYDGPLQDAVITINDESANNADAVKLAKLLGAKLQPGETFNKESAVKAIKELAAGRRRASR